MTLYRQLRGMYGLGDTIYMRAVVAEAIKQNPAQLYSVMTPWPQIWLGLTATQRSGTTLRMQKRNEDASAHLYAPPPPRSSFNRRLHIGYGGEDFKGNRSMLDKLAQQIGVALPESVSVGWTVPEEWKCRPNAETICRDDPEATDAQRAEIASRPLAFVRPPTVRKEWEAPARNPDQAAFFAMVCSLMNTHHVVSVASIEEKKEWLVGEIPAHTRFEHGELDFQNMMGLLAASDVALGGVGFLLPALQTVQTRGVILAGGALMGNGPTAVMDNRMDWTRVKMILPDEGEQCWCTQYRHNCKRKTDPGRAIDEMRQHFSTTQREAA